MKQMSKVISQKATSPSCHPCEWICPISTPSITRFLKPVRVTPTQHLNWFSYFLHSSPKHMDCTVKMIKVLRTTRHKISHFGDVVPSQSLGLVPKMKQTQQKQTHIHNKIHYNIKLTKKLKPGLVASYDLQPGNRAGLF